VLASSAGLALSLRAGWEDDTGFPQEGCLYRPEIGRYNRPRKADVAQLVEQPIRNRQVTGSSPVVGSSDVGTNFGSLLVLYPFFLFYFRSTACAPNERSA
jgi:hypothetical protein